MAQVSSEVGWEGRWEKLTLNNIKNAMLPSYSIVGFEPGSTWRAETLIECS